MFITLASIHEMKALKLIRLSKLRNAYRITIVRVPLKEYACIICTGASLPRIPLVHMTRRIPFARVK